MKRILAVAALAGFAAINPACAEKLKVVASFSIIADFAREVGKDHIELTTLVGPGSDAHVYEPKPADAAAMKDAAVILVNGLHFEGFLERLVKTSGATGVVAELTKGVETLAAGESHGDHDHGGEDHGDHEKAAEAHEGHDHGDIDPHAFQSAANAEIYVRNVADAFCAADAANCDDYKANAQSYSEQLKALDAEIKAQIAAVPVERRKVITTHDAFAYFAHAYGVTFLSPKGISTEAEASAADVARLIRQVRDDKASAIFVENITNARLIEQIAAETGLTIGGTLYSDALTDGPPAATYVDLMRANARTISDALTSAKAP